MAIDPARQGFDMKIHRLSGIEGAREARGVTAVIDVFRAFTCEPLMYHFGATQIILMHDIEACRRFTGKALLAGEEDGRPIEGFDLSNSPSQIIALGKLFFEGRTVIHRTTSGVAGALTALERSDEVLLASFVTARVTAQHILELTPDEVSLVAMGVAHVTETPEDDLCGDYLESLLTGSPYDHIGALNLILGDESAQKFMRGDKPYYPREDVVICLQRDLFDFVLRAERRDGMVEVVPSSSSA